MEHGARTKLLSALVLALVFGSGVLVGYASDRTLHLAEEPAEESADTISSAQHERRQPVYAQLEPNAEQTAQIDSILRVNRKRINELHEEFRKQQEAYQANYDAVILEVREAIAQVFPPDVREEYRRLLAESDARRAERDGERARK
ncbi:MAG TPA: hypothetical protein VFQ22_10920 [Longimicrobiales bacterium]|nr:hypothetical protein [Longimicrobiales bacterium]